MASRSWTPSFPPPTPSGFSDTKRYRDRLRALKKGSAEHDAFVSGVGEVLGHPVSIGAFAFEFMGGSMGSVVGEKVTRLFERAHARKTPALIFCSSGGARMPRRASSR